MATRWLSTMNMMGFRGSKKDPMLRRSTYEYRAAAQHGLVEVRTVRGLRGVTDSCLIWAGAPFPRISCGSRPAAHVTWTRSWIGPAMYLSFHLAGFAAMASGRSLSRLSTRSTRLAWNSLRGLSRKDGTRFRTRHEQTGDGHTNARLFRCRCLL